MDTTAPVDIAPIESPTPEPVSDDSSLADHEASFGRDREARTERVFEAGDDEPETPSERDDKGRFRHRASSQKATPEDVAEISRLTKELRETEQRLGDKDPDAATSPRIRTLKRQIAALKALETPASAPSAEPVKPAEPVRVANPATKPADSRPKPTEDEIGTKYATYGDFVEDLADWKVEQREAAREAKRQETEASERETALITKHQQRMSEFAQKTPDFHTVTAPMMSQHLPGLLLAALVSDDKGPENVYYLAQHPDILDELILLTDGKEVTDASVAVVQRRVSGRAQAVQTGSVAAAKPAFIPPRPPNPVRTGPNRTGDEPPGDDSSLAEHEKAYGRRR